MVCTRIIKLHHSSKNARSENGSLVCSEGGNLAHGYKKFSPLDTWAGPDEGLVVSPSLSCIKVTGVGR